MSPGSPVTVNIVMEADTDGTDSLEHFRVLSHQLMQVGHCGRHIVASYNQHLGVEMVVDGIRGSRCGEDAGLMLWRRKFRHSEIAGGSMSCACTSSLRR